MRFVLIGGVVGFAAGHGAMTLPPTRLSMTTKSSGQCEGTQVGRAPQYNMTCFWFNEGCTIGCKSCGGLECGHLKASSVGKCCAEQMKPTLTDPQLRTYKDLFGVLDIPYYHTPWRAPGFAPVYDPCGTAGGVPVGVDPGPINPPPTGVKQGLSGQDLPEMPGVKTTWTAGSVQDVAWGINANHGGGYAYRLCPKMHGAKATEACFQENHLQFSGDMSWIQYGDDESNRTAFPAVRTSQGTNPSGSQWTKNPIPACGNLAGGGLHTSTVCQNPQFDPILKDVIKPHSKFAPEAGLYGFGMGHCVSMGHKHNGSITPGLSACSDEELEFWRARFNFNIIDKVHIPATLAPGEYLLSFRWDTEQTPQIWTNCADVTITSQTELTVV